MTKAAVDKKRQLEQQTEKGVYVTSTGYRTRLVPVAGYLIDDIVAQVEDPPIPMFFNEDKGREEENPLDPNYLDALNKARFKRVSAQADALILFGIELLDPMPEDDKWLKKFKRHLFRNSTLVKFQLRSYNNNASS